MEAETAPEAATTQDLSERLAQAREQLESLVRDVRAIDTELESIATERKQHGLLHDACRALEELEELGGARLFWDGIAAEKSEEQVRRARTRVAAFQQRISEIEQRRQSLIDEIVRQEQHALLLEDDVFEALEEEERQKHEWVVEREIESLRAREPLMPWIRKGEDDRRFRKALAAAVIASLVVAIVMPLIEIPLRAPDETVEIPERVVTLMMEEQEVLLPPPPPPVVKPKPQTEPQQPQEQRVASVEPEQAPEATEVAPEPQGILAFREKLALKETPVVAQLGSQARINSDDSSAARPERSMLTTNAPGSSGGIKLASLSRNFGPNGGSDRGPIQGAALTQASSRIAAIAPAGRPLSDGPGLARTDEEIQIVFDRYKSALYRLYNRELRRDPTLQGQMVLRLTIEPNGSVSFCQLHSTDMNAPDLVVQIVERVRGFDFGAKEVPAITIVYPIDFLPAA